MRPYDKNSFPPLRPAVLASYTVLELTPRPVPVSQNVKGQGKWSCKNCRADSSGAACHGPWAAFSRPQDNTHKSPTHLSTTEIIPLTHHYTNRKVWCNLPLLVYCPRIFGFCTLPPPHGPVEGGPWLRPVPSWNLQAPPPQHTDCGPAQALARAAVDFS